ncbi:MAG: M1 family metallopeptidase [Hyphomicrobiales bacterium]|nr:M1 family metallopeptidase [Hyphomicrobiales bacterium]MBV8825707.1 M1 family metallopeptidase [Hyphomicrobiales bacterium]MBV9428668.1 M1 family metallopeptidase [Bradyrhizobiaceae bacterium]
MRLPTNVIPDHYDLFVKPDLDKLRFDGSVKIRLDVREPIQEIILHTSHLKLHRAVLDPNAQKATDIVYNDTDQTATLKFGGNIERGTHYLLIDYEGAITDSAPEGLFVSRYDTPDGQKRMLLTQFEAIAARRFLPCWDEPAFKATFSVSVAAPKGDLVISNMPIESESALEDGLRHVRFQESPKMSSYLLFLGMGDLERLETTVGSTKVAVVARRGSVDKGKFALESSVQLLKFYNDYFGVPYPLPKLDLIAAPGAGGFSAMENWGAILYFETVLLVDPALSPESARQRVFVVVAHEMAHQWFGNLVTMEWWDNLWLNEGFASWMENKATENFHRDWMIWLQSESARQEAMRQDAKRTTHPVVVPVTSGDPNQQFDRITYKKGEAVIRMLENYVGEVAFRDGVRTYMQRYQYQNTVSDNLWAELEKSAKKEIKPIADDFTLQPGVPLIAVDAEEATGSQATLKLRQGRFAVDDSANDVLTWRVPVSAAPAGSATPTAVEIVKGPGSATLPVGGSPPIKINIGQTAYYRSQYAPQVLDAIAARFASLEPADQLGLLYDTWALGEAGAAPVEGYLESTQNVPLKADTSVWAQVIETLQYIDRLYAGLPARAVFRDFARATLAPKFERVGWDASAGEPDNVAVLREDLLYGLGQFGDPDVVAEARRRFQAFVKDPKSLPAAIRLPTLRITGLWADQDLYDTLHSLAAKATDPVDKDQLFVSLASARDPVRANSSLKIAINGEPVPSTGLIMISRVAIDNPDLAWQFALDNVKVLDPWLDAMQHYSFVPSLAATATSSKRLADLRRYIDAVPEGPRKQLERYYADLEYRLKVISLRVPQIDAWLAAHPHKAVAAGLHP